MKLKRIIIILSVLALAFLSGITWLVGAYFIDFALKRGTAADPMAPPKASVAIVTANLKPPAKPDYRNQLWTIKVGGEKRVATAFFTDAATDKWVIMVHGYCRDQRYVYDYARIYLNNGYNVLTPDLNASGASEGQYLTAGLKESKDILAWSQLLVSKYSTARISLHGVSMGAATVMLAAKEKLPENVYAVIEDCGYTSAYAMFAMQAKRLFGLPAFPVLNMIDVVHKIKLGYFMSDAAPIKYMEQVKLPLMFIHGEKDTLIPAAMAEELYQASGSSLKEKLIIPQAEHARSISTDTQTYFSRVLAFLQKAEKKK